jgi:hypothetical protein
MSLSLSLPCVFYSLQGKSFSYLSFLRHSGNTTTEYPVYSTLPVESTIDYLPVDITISALLSLAILQATMRCALLYLADTTTNPPLCFACRYSTRLSAALLCLSILQPTIQSTNHPLFSLWRYSNRLSNPPRCSNRLFCVLYSIQRKYNRLYALLCLSIFQPTLRRSTLAVDITTAYPLSRLSDDTPTDYPIYRRHHGGSF